jgi:membrane protein implicated in regulation of membrane protease activity
MKRLWVALSAFAVLMVLTLITIDDQKYRLGALAILAMFAIRTWTHSRKQQRKVGRRRDDDEDDD